MLDGGHLLHAFEFGARHSAQNIAADMAVRFEPGQRRTVEQVDYAGECKVYGFQDKIQGVLK